MEMFRQVQEQRAAQKLAHQLQQDFQSDKPNWNSQDFLALAEHAIQRGNHYGLNSDNLYYRFAKVMIIFGNDFDTSIPEVQQILAQPNEQAWIKINKLDAWAFPDNSSDSNE